MIHPSDPNFKNTPVSNNRSRFDYKLADTSVSPCVSIITPFYNTGSVFYETAHSVLQQSLQQWEWLIINDGSTKADALGILKKFRNSDPRIRVIDHTTNKGLSAARNTGFQEARTQYIVQLDSDDLLEPTAIEKWFWFLKSYPEFSFCKGYTVGFGAEEYLWQKGFHNGRAFLEGNLVDPTGMVHKPVHQQVEGYDENDHGGLMDWEFWLRCASHGYWGGTIPEYLNWYRRRTNHSDRWADFDNGRRQRAYRAKLKKKYAHLWNGGFPQIELQWHMPNEIISDELPCENHLRKENPRLLFIVPWMTVGGADTFNLNLVKQLTTKGWEITFATTLKADHSWLPEYARYTPDIFILDHFLRLVDYPRFLRYLIASRQVDVVMISNSELGYLLLPYLRAHFPDVTFVDYCHMEEENWKNGGYPRLAVEYEKMLDLNIVSSKHLKRWMCKRRAESEQIEVCYTNVDANEWRPLPKQRHVVRQEMGLDDTVPLILYAGRICIQKQPRVFCKTLQELRKRNTSFIALVAGDGPDMEWLHSFINKHQLQDNVRLLGTVSNERIKQLMAAADVLFLPSQWEGVALIIYEAMACGLPVVGAAVGGQRELVTPECGVLMPRNNEKIEAKQYAKVLEDLLNNPRRCKAMGQAGRARVRKHFHIKQMGEQMLALFEKAISLHATDSRPQPDIGLGRVCATQAVEYIRLFQFSEWLWNQHNQPTGASKNLNFTNWRRRIYQLLNRLYDPFYQRYIGRGWVWLSWHDPIREKIKYALLRQ